MSAGGSGAGSGPGLPTGGPTSRLRSRAGRDLPAAIGVGAGLSAALIASLTWWVPGFVILVATLIGMAAAELHRALKSLGMNSALVVIEVGIVVLLSGAYVIERHTDLPTATFIVVCLGAMVLAAFLARIPGGPHGFIRDTAASMLTITYLPLMGSFASLLVAADHGPARVFMWLGAVICSDTGGYVAGVLLGRHRMAPGISPKKTWEGFGGSLLLGAVFGIPMAQFALGIPWWVGAGIGLLLAAAGTCGDLVESMFKRDLGIKDMGTLLPGHGGVTDRIDSMLLSAPVAWLLMHFLVPGA